MGIVAVDQQQSYQVSVVANALALLASRREQFLDFLARRTGSRADAEDLLQQGFLRATRKVAGLRDSAMAEAWFYRILRRLLADERSRESQQRRSAIALEVEPVEASPDVATTCACSIHLIDTLPPQYADILRRVDLSDESAAEIADALSLTPGNVLVRLHRARKALRQRLLEVCGTSSSAACAHCCCNGAPPVK